MVMATHVRRFFVSRPGRLPMRAGLLAYGAVAVAFLIVSLPMFAHHGAGAYDLQRSLTLDGTVTSLEWSNPHCLLRFEAKNEKSEVLHWTIEMYNPLWMSRAGWKRTSLKGGDQITVTFHPARNGTPNGFIRDGDGKIVFGGKELGMHQAGDERGPGQR